MAAPTNGERLRGNSKMLNDLESETGGWSRNRSHHSRRVALKVPADAILWVGSRARLPVPLTRSAAGTLW